MSALRVLRLDNNQFSGQVSNRLGQLVNLVNLNLSRNKLSGGRLPLLGDVLLTLHSAQVVFQTWGTVCCS